MQQCGTLNQHFLLLLIPLKKEQLEPLQVLIWKQKAGKCLNFWELKWLLTQLKPVTFF